MSDFDAIQIMGDIISVRKQGKRSIKVKEVRITDELFVNLVTTVRELIESLTDGWKIIVSVTVICLALAISHSFLSQEMYQAQTLLVPIRNDSSAVSRNFGQFGSIGAFAGIDLTVDSKTNQLISTLSSRHFIGQFIAIRAISELLSSWDRR